ncbi:hypothetical protein ASPBRDRAFT_313406 [Aspergillus brasiliensis CBS 101740]|uniref:Uncharacterized protein n=1 Tax=Aspergillus brasiliensis (strain CBS 101740 / IMI 381727 / IBT 21946) TaxID=767769 RepID=A0A1L9UAQ4_ASPBC|nr:hypothetical protein ASPBRDRAFT_313406 [Aspergillus brasiliensis CBS 101740]
MDLLLTLLKRAVGLIQSISAQLGLTWKKGRESGPVGLPFFATLFLSLSLPLSLFFRAVGDSRTPTRGSLSILTGGCYLTRIQYAGYVVCWLAG